MTVIAKASCWQCLRCRKYRLLWLFVNAEGPQVEVELPHNTHVHIRLGSEMGQVTEYVPKCFIGCIRVGAILAVGISMADSGKSCLH